MRLSRLVLATIITVALFVACRPAQAKHRYFANLHPLGNYLNRCLGVGWSDGYHAPGGWDKHHCRPHRHVSVPTAPRVKWVHPAFAPHVPTPLEDAHFRLPHARYTRPFGQPLEQR